MTTTFTSRPLSRHCGARSAAVSYSPADHRRPVEINESTRHFALEQAIRKATADLRRSVKLLKPSGEGLYSPLSGRHVSPSGGTSFPGRISRCRQQL